MADRRIFWLGVGVAGLALAGIVVLRLLPAPEPAAPPPTRPAPAEAAAPALPLFPDAPPETLAAVVPSPVEGQEGGTTLIESVWEEAEERLRLRFLRPDLAGTEDFVAIEAQMAALCRQFALPLIAAEGWPVREIVVSLAERALPVGVFDPEVMQIFEAYRPENGDCIWEEF
jgi:hypothetical protein